MIKLKGFDAFFNIFLILFLLLLGFGVAYPFFYTLSISISDPMKVVRQEVFLFPKGFNTEAYRRVLNHDLIWIGYKNTILYTATATVFRVTLLVMTAYPLSKKKFPGRNIFMFIIFFTMLFSGGLIPTFLVVKGLGLLNTLWAMVIPGALTAYFVIITRTFFQNTIPESLEESAKLDGANDIQILLKIVVPLSAPIISVMGLFIAVGVWNNFFQALIYLRDSSRYPLTMVIRGLVILGAVTEIERIAREEGFLAMPTQSLKAAALVVSILPIMAVYPFIQRYFVKGIMIGAIRE